MICKTCSLSFYEKSTGDALIFNYCDVLWVKSACCVFLAQSIVLIVYVRALQQKYPNKTNKCN